MTTSEVSLGFAWALSAILFLAVAACRRRLAPWLIPRVRFWRSWANPHRGCELSLLLIGIGLGAWSLAAMYCAVVLIPRLDHTLAAIRLTAQPTYQAAANGRAI
jgi:hypothetical protein